MLHELIFNLDKDKFNRMGSKHKTIDWHLFFKIFQFRSACKTDWISVPINLFKTDGITYLPSNEKDVGGEQPPTESFKPARSRR